MGYAFSQFFWSIAGELCVAAIIGVVAVIWGMWEGTKRWTAVLGGIVVMAAIFLMLNQSGWWEPPVKVKIHRWLDDVSFSVRDIPPAANSDLEFLFEVTADVDIVPVPSLVFYISRSTHGGDGFIVMKIGYDQVDSFPELKNIGAQEMHLLNRQIRKDLSMKDINYSFYKDGKIELKYAIAASSINQEQLMRGYEKLSHSVFVVTQDIGIALKDTREGP